jgi:hypothetical protein
VMDSVLNRDCFGILGLELHFLVVIRHAPALSLDSSDFLAAVLLS